MGNNIVAGETPLELHPDKDSAESRLPYWAAKVVEMRLQDTHGVTARPVPGQRCWGVYVVAHRPEGTALRTERLKELSGQLPFASSRRIR